MVYGSAYSRCLPLIFVVVNVVLACVDAGIAAVAFSQLVRIHLRNQRVGWTRQKVFHLMIGCSNIGYLVYFITTLVATCERWLCWLHVCGFIIMAGPQILFIAAFLLLLSFWVDLCHQENDEDEEEEDDYLEALLEKTKSKPGAVHVDNHRKCCPFRGIHIGSRQKIVILVIVLVFVLMIAFAVLIWVGRGKNHIDSQVAARVYLDLFAVAIFLLGGALTCYGLMLCLKMSKVKSERAASEMWKVAGLAIVSLVCFTSCALVAMVTNIPLPYVWHSDDSSGVKTSLLIMLYYFIGSSIPSAFVLWVMREMPPQLVVNRQTQTRVVTFIRDGPAVNPHPQRWTAATSSQNQALKVSPI